MASIISFLILLLLPTKPAAFSRSGLIEKTCNTTTYYDFCVSSLASDPQSATADVRGLSAIAIALAISNATNTSSYAAGLSRNATDPALRSLLSACAAKYSNAREALQSSLDALSAESYDYAAVHVGAASEYPAVCRALFRQRPKVAVYPAELALREESMEHLCTIALDIISLLG